MGYHGYAVLTLCAAVLGGATGSSKAGHSAKPVVEVPARPAGYAYGQHDCFMGPPDLCQHSLLNDTACRGKYATNIEAWRDMECDYVRYNVKANNQTDDWIIIHAGGAGGCGRWVMGGHRWVSLCL